MAIAFVGFTADSRIVGSIPLTDDRLSDMLNSVARVVIRDASVEDVDLGPLEGGAVTVPCGDFLAVVATGRRGFEGRRTRTEVRHVQLGLGRYVVTGDIHVRPEAAIAATTEGLDALLTGNELLVPLTDSIIQYTRAGKPCKERWQTLLVNRARAAWIRPAEDAVEQPEEEELVEEGPTRTRYVKDFTGTVAE
ncbi:MAG TPA: hypothetical protein VKA85_09875 [Candidatus Limnocylindrales bacterium]|nr:hypothetical protein [Candidatus Limnocylindrales bacterium]